MTVMGGNGLFGYIRIHKDELKIKDYNLFKAYYCGVCQTIKKEYGFPARYFLSYDAAFLALMLSSVSPEPVTVKPIRCLANPLIRRPAAEKDAILSYAASVNVLLVWFKIIDDWKDNHSLRSLFLMPFMVGKRNKARKRFPELYKKMEASLGELSVLEKAGCDIPDQVAGVFGQLMEDIFDTDLIQTEEKRRILSRCGYLLGRFIYILDAWADKDEDEQKKAYNPFLASGGQDAGTLRLSLEYTLGELANNIVLLNVTKNKDIIDNVIYLGLEKSLENVFSGSKNKVKEKQHERPI
ncbi:MAG: hypothetical protein II997_00455 [Clostridia bacterium]|nr:hypothetical protein [Clostridia bacterium]